MITMKNIVKISIAGVKALDDALGKEKSREFRMLRFDITRDVTVDLEEPIELRKAGIKALTDALGEADMRQFMEFKFGGTGDSLAEKYERPEESFEEIMAGIREHNDKVMHSDEEPYKSLRRKREKVKAIDSPLKKEDTKFLISTP